MHIMCHLAGRGHVWIACQVYDCHATLSQLAFYLVTADFERWHLHRPYDICLWANDCQAILSQSNAAVYKSPAILALPFTGGNRLFIKAASVFPQLP